MKKHWSIWSIKSRWLRVAVAWPAFVLSAIGLVAMGVIIAVVVGAVALWRSAADTAREVLDTWKEIRPAAWAAMTGKDEPA